MESLDSPKEIEKFDKGKILASIRLLPDQVEQAWQEITEIKHSYKRSNIDNVVICGMGGSALGGRIVNSLVMDRIKLPLQISTEYDIPNFVNSNTLVIGTSYSGNTEETLSAVRQASKMKARIFGITTGGKLAKFLKSEKFPAYIYKPLANPSEQPRMALGYSIAATLSLLNSFGFVSLPDDLPYEIASVVRKLVKEYDLDVSSHENLAKTIAKKIKNKIPVLIASEHLYGAAHAFKNQLNENAKAYSNIFDIPELNHHLMEGLKFPAKARELLYFVFYKSDLYRKELKKRYDITADVVSKNGYPYTIFSPITKTKITQVFETLTFGSFVSFYLAALHGVDPSKIPWVDYFKDQLAKS